MGRRESFNSFQLMTRQVHSIHLYMIQGKVKFFDTKKGFGFIAPDEGGKDVFVHRNNVENLGYNEGLEDGESVEFEVEETPKGLSAINVNSLDYK